MLGRDEAEKKYIGVKDIQAVFYMLRDASSKELGIISLFLLPLLFGIWYVFFNELKWWKVVLLIAYVVALVYMKSNDKLARARYHVKTRLKKKGGRASFDFIREKVNETYSDDFLNKLIEMNPKLFGKCDIKRSDGARPGITLEVAKLEDE